MASILYYSNFCEHSKRLIQTFSKSQVSKDLHFMCIDKRVKEKDGKIYARKCYKGSRITFIE